MIIQLPEKLYDFYRLYYSETGYKVHSGDKNAAPVSREAAGIWLFKAIPRNSRLTP